MKTFKKLFLIVCILTNICSFAQCKIFDYTFEAYINLAEKNESLHISKQFEIQLDIAFENYGQDYEGIERIVEIQMNSYVTLIGLVSDKGGEYSIFINDNEIDIMRRNILRSMITHYKYNNEKPDSFDTPADWSKVLRSYINKLNGLV